ncbi:MAG: hypothetical protein K9J79_12215 [Desulfobacteraceae bacterium]|nr:hypothetical protein [Desulfobacteraceae bacterium]MCF8096113.1 hypothetical protein [Desulfobacteraceae bacterium]
MRSLSFPSIKTAFSAALILVLIFSATSAYCASTSSAEQKIVAIGHSRIYSDVAAAKNAAVSDGLLSVVQNTASQLLSPEELTENFGTVAGVLIRHQNEFILSYRILDEHQTEKHYQVLIQATVSKQKIKEAFTEGGLRAAPVKMPSVLFMIAEKNIDDLDFDYWWRKGYSAYSEQIALSPIKQVFLQKGFTVIDPDKRQKDTDNKELFSGLELDAEPADYEASIIANRLGADIVVIGKATAQTTSNRMGEDIRTFKANINLRVVDTDTGEKLTTINEQDITVSRNPEKAGKNALADAAYRAGGQLSDRLVSIWRKASQTADKFIISVKGDSVLTHLEKLRSALKQDPGISGLRTTEMSVKSATLALDYEGTAQELADKLLMQSFTGFGINISDISPEGLSAELIPE